MTKLKLRFMIIVMKFIQHWSIHHGLDNILYEAKLLEDDLELKLEEYND